MKLFLVLFFLLFPTSLFAYIDPGSGSALITAILGFFAAITYSLRKFFYNIRSKLTGKSSHTDEND
jgi:hypothetical protein